MDIDRAHWPLAIMGVYFGTGATQLPDGVHATVDLRASKADLLRGIETLWNWVREFEGKRPGASARRHGRRAWDDEPGFSVAFELLRSKREGGAEAQWKILRERLGPNEQRDDGALRTLATRLRQEAEEQVRAQEARLSRSCEQDAHVQVLMQHLQASGGEAPAEDLQRFIELTQRTFPWVGARALGATHGRYT